MQIVNENRKQYVPKYMYTIHECSELYVFKYNLCKVYTYSVEKKCRTHLSFQKQLRCMKIAWTLQTSYLSPGNAGEVTIIVFK